MKNKRSQISRQERRRRQRQALRQTGARALGLESLEARYALASVPILSDLNANGASTPSDFIEVNGVTYFVATNATNGRELWTTDGTAQGTKMLVDVNVGAGSADPTNLVNVNGVLYFSAKDSANGRELWRTDGTSGGTYMVKDLFTGTYQYGYQQIGNSSNPSQLTNVGGKLFFIARNGVSGAELWSSDGTSAGTAMVKDIYAGVNGQTPSSSSPTQLTNYNGALYFVADDGLHGRELWKSDGTDAGTVMVKDIYQGTYQYTPTGGGSAVTRQNSSHPGLLHVLNGQLYFVANDGTHGAELWKTNGAEAGTELVKDIRSGADSAFTSSSLMEVVGNLLLFSANDGTTGDELWRSDGTQAGTALVKDLRSGAAGDVSYFGSFTVVDNVLYFSGNDGTNGKELWKSDGTEAGTVMLADIWTGSFASGETSQGPHSSLPAYITNVNGTLYFSAYTGEAGRELWKYTPAGGASLVADTVVGANSVDPTFITEVNGRVFFSGNVASGKELFSLVEAESYQLSIYVDGATVTVPSTVGLQANGEFASSFTTAAGKVNYTSGAQTKLGEFFNVWKTNAGLAGNNANAVFSPTQILGNVATSEKTVQMFVNGQVVRDFADYVVKPGDDIVIIYGSNPVVALNTTYGTILIELYEDETPITVANFLNYVNDGDYNNSIFHRADSDFVIQGGGFTTSSNTFTNTSQFTEIPADPMIQNEPGISNLRGTIAMAKLGGKPNSATSQFFVNLSDNNKFLDEAANNAFTVFGKILSMTTVDKIANLPISAQSADPYKELPVGADGKLAVVSTIQGLGDVSGVRFVDLNLNGVQDSGEEGLVGAVVYDDVNNNGVHDSGEASTLTDDDGKYRLQLTPGTHTIRIVASARGTQTLPAAGAAHSVTVEIGSELVRNFGESIELAPSGVALVAASDTGESPSDRITSLNNSAGKQLQFIVTGVAPGGEVNLYSDDTLIGSATAVGSSVTITTNGAAILNDGLHEIYARQKLSGVESSDSLAVIVTIDTTTPAAISSTPATTVELGGTFSYDAASTDEGDADTTYSLDNEPNGMTINPTTGVIQWTPAADQAKTYQFIVRLADKAGNATQQTVRLTVTGALNILPDDYTVAEGGTLTVPTATGVRANDENGNSLTVSLKDTVSHGTLTLNGDGSFIYTPDDDFSGVDSFTYTASDGSLQGNETTVTINVTAVNDPPVGVADAYQTNEDTVLTIGVDAGVLANDSDPDDNDELTVEVVQDPASGTLELNDDGSFVYTPQGDFNGTVTFTYRISDGTTTSDPITVTLTVAAVNDPPVANPDSYTTDEDVALTIDAASGVLANDTDVEGDAKTAVLEQNAQHGTVNLNANGSFTYTPTANYSGQDTFTYRVKDANGQSQPITVTITVTGVNDAPTTVNDTKSVANDGTTQEVDVLANDTGGPSETETLKVTAVTQGNNGGTVTISSDGSKVQYKPAASFTGTETFTYTVIDPDGLTKTGTVTMTVTAATSTGVISGIVFFDADNDGVRDTGEAGVPGVLVTLASTSTGTNITRTAITKNDGTYSFTALPAGTYKVTESQPMAMNDGVEKSADTGATITDDVIANIVLTSAETAANNNFGERLLKPAYTSIRWFFASSQTNNTYFREVIAQGEDSAGNDELAAAIRNGDTTFTASSSSATAAAALLAEEEAAGDAASNDDTLASLAYASLVAEEESESAVELADESATDEAAASRRSGSDQSSLSSDLDDDAVFDLLDDPSSIDEEIDALDEAFAELQSWRAA